MIWFYVIAFIIIAYIVFKIVFFAILQSTSTLEISDELLVECCNCCL